VAVPEGAHRCYKARMRLLVVAAGVALAACALGSTAAPAPRSRACPRASHAASLSAWAASPVLRGDVDGDGHPDRISIRYAAGAPASCGFLLLAETRSGPVVTRVPESYKPPMNLSVREWPFPDPYLAAAVQLDARRSQVVVARWHGASVASVSLYGLVHGRLVILSVGRGPRAGEIDLFGTVGTGDTNVRCLRGGPLVLFGKGPTSASGRHWRVVRSEYRLTGARLRMVRIRTATTTEKGALALQRRWGMDALPFTGCTVARGRRL
jgi:hypothetical protein